jgi:hypothetical protein
VLRTGRTSVVTMFLSSICLMLRALTHQGFTEEVSLKKVKVYLKLLILGQETKIKAPIIIIKISINRET